MSEHRASFEKGNADAEPVGIGRRLPSGGQDPNPGLKDTESERSPQEVSLGPVSKAEMREIRRSGLMSGIWKRRHGQLLGHRQPKGSANTL
jgi:hypothetical protein